MRPPAMYCTAEFAAATNGTANTAPAMPPSSDPVATVSTTATGCSRTALPMSSGCRMCDSSWFTPITPASMISACTGPT